jgi:hypothetical protein
MKCKESQANTELRVIILAEMQDSPCNSGGFVECFGLK